jgi:hypothetical protein
LFFSLASAFAPVSAFALAAAWDSASRTVEMNDRAAEGAVMRPNRRDRVVTLRPCCAPRIIILTNRGSFYARWAVASSRADPALHSVPNAQHCIENIKFFIVSAFLGVAVATGSWPRCADIAALP